MKDRVVKKLKEMNEEVGVYVQEGLDKDLHTIKSLLTDLWPHLRMTPSNRYSGSSS